MDKQETNIKRLAETFPSELLAGLLVGTLTGLAEAMNEDSERFIEEWIESTINQINAIVGSSD